MAGRVITFCLLVFLPMAVSADSLTGRVVKVVDGDTVYVLDANHKQHKIRLAGIDAPERKQPYGLASRKHLASIVVGKPVAVEYDKQDRYGRIVGKVWVDGVDVCLEQVKAGFAWHYKKYQYEQSGVTLTRRCRTRVCREQGVTRLCWRVTAWVYGK